MIWLAMPVCPALFAQISFPKDTDLCQHEPWKLVFHDEFNGASLDKSKWITYNPSWDNASADYLSSPPADDPSTAMHMIKVDDDRSFYSPKNIAVGGGNCRLSFRYEPQDTFGGTARFTAAKLFHKVPFHSGRFDIRCKIPRASGVWAAFWVMGVRPCDDALAPGGGEIDFFEYAPCESDLTTLSTTITGYKRFGCEGPTPSDAEHYKVDNIGEWHLYSTEWDRNFVRSYVDGKLMVEQSRYAHGKVPAGCNPGQSIHNGLWEERAGFFPYYDSLHNQSLQVELKSSHDLYSVNFMGICTPSLRSRRHIEEHLAERVWVIDYIRVYQRENNIQTGLRDLCPAVKGPATIRGKSTDRYTYTVDNYSTIRNFRWLLGEGVGLVADHGSSIDVVFTGVGDTRIGGTWDRAEDGCEGQSYYLPIQVAGH